jgi:hypothetical protein
VAYGSLRSGALAVLTRSEGCPGAVGSAMGPVSRLEAGPLERRAHRSELRG